MNSNQYYDPDAMAQEYADKAQSNINFNLFQNSPIKNTDETFTQGNKETAKSDHTLKDKKSYTDCPFIKVPVIMKPNKHGIAIEITGEYFMQDESTAYIDYQVQGFTEEKGGFETIKGFFDFAKIREKLVNGWKGCKIPTLPHPSFFYNSQDRDSDARRETLVTFLKGVADFPYLFYSADFQEFLGSGTSSSKEHTDFIQKSSQMKNPVNMNTNMNKMPILFRPSENIGQIPIPQNNHENKKNKHGIKIHITGESRHQNDSIVYIDYNIKGSSAENGEFETFKGYLDFVIVRENLMIGWPGCAIPALPPANLFCNYTDFNGNARRDGLVKFLKDVAGFPFLFYSAHFQEFLKSGPSSAKQQTDFIKQGSKMKKSSNVFSKIFENIGGSVQNKDYNSNRNQNISKPSPPIQNNTQQASNLQNNSQIKSVPPQNQNQNKNPSVTIIGDFQRAGSFGGMHKEYHIRGYDEKGMFEVNRRYNDFMLIREILVEKWPMVQFQELPRRFRSEGENEQFFQNERSKGLIAFLQSITGIDFVFYSPEWQTFIKDPSPKIADKLKSFKKGIFSKIFGK